VIWVGKNLAEQGIICCIYNIRDIGMVWIAITLANTSADEGCYSLYVSTLAVLSIGGRE